MKRRVFLGAAGGALAVGQALAKRVWPMGSPVPPQKPTAAFGSLGLAQAGTIGENVAIQTPPAVHRIGDLISALEHDPTPASWLQQRMGAPPHLLALRSVSPWWVHHRMRADEVARQSAVASEARRLIEGSGVPVRFFPMWLRRKAGLEAG